MDLQLSTLKKRLLAFFIDVLLLVIIVSLLMFVFSWSKVISGIIPASSWYLYFVLMEHLGSATIGKKLMGIRVVDKNGNKIGFVRSLVRQVSKVFCIATIIPIIDILLFRRKYNWYDNFSGTFVVNNKQN